MPWLLRISSSFGTSLQFPAGTNLLHHIGHLHLMKTNDTLPEAHIASENEWLEDVPFLLGVGLFSKQTVSFSPGLFFIYTIIPYISIPTKSTYWITEFTSMKPGTPPPATWLPRSAVPDLRTSPSSCLKNPSPYPVSHKWRVRHGNQWSWYNYISSSFSVENRDFSNKIRFL